MMSSKSERVVRIIGAGQVRESAHGGDLASSWEMQMCPENNGVHVMCAALGRPLTPPTPSVFALGELAFLEKAKQRTAVQGPIVEKKKASFRRPMLASFDMGLLPYDSLLAERTALRQRTAQQTKYMSRSSFR